MKDVVRLCSVLKDVAHYAILKNCVIALIIRFIDPQSAQFTVFKLCKMLGNRTDVVRLGAFAGLLLLLIGCTSRQVISSPEVSSTVTSTNHFVSPPPATYSSLPTPTDKLKYVTVQPDLSTLTPSSASHPILPNNPLPEFPLSVGNTWTYSATYIGSRFNQESSLEEPLTATYIITDQVVATRTYDSLFGAEIKRVSTLIRGTSFDEFDGSDVNWESENPKSRYYSYVISQTLVYQQDELDFPNLRVRKSDSGAFKYPLVLDFSFLSNPESNCWYSGIGESGDCYDRAEWSLGGFYYVSEGPISLNTPAANFKNCYIITWASRGGGRNQQFCIGTGIVGSNWLDQGQSWDLYPPKGYDIKLIAYSLADQ